MIVEAEFKWNEKTKILLGEAPEKVLFAIARQTLDYTGTSKVVAYRKGKTEGTMLSEGVKGDFNSGFYIGNFTDYASYVYVKEGVNWTNPNTKTKWFEYIWKKHGKTITQNAIKEYKI